MYGREKTPLQELEYVTIRLQACIFTACMLCPGTHFKRVHPEEWESGQNLPFNRNKSHTRATKRQKKDVLVSNVLEPCHQVSAPVQEHAEDLKLEVAVRIAADLTLEVQYMTLKRI